MKRAGVYTTGNKNQVLQVLRVSQDYHIKKFCTLYSEVWVKSPGLLMDIDIHIFLKVPRFRHRSYSIIRVQMWQFGTEHKDHLNTWLNLFNDTMHDLAWQEAPLSKTKVPPGQIHLSLEILTIINWEWKLISRWWIVGETKLCIPSIRADKWFWCIVLCCTHDMKCMDGGPPAGQHDKIIFCLIIQSWHVSVQWWGAPLKFLFLFLFQSLTLTHELLLPWQFLPPHAGVANERKL